MPRVNIPIRFGGLDSKSDPRAVPLTSTLELQNCTFQAPGALSCRNGYEALPAKFANLRGGTPDASGKIASGQGIFTFGDELLLSDGSYLYSYNAAAGNWILKSQLECPALAKGPVHRGPTNATHPDGCVHPAGVRAFVWEDSGGGSYLVLQDATTGQELLPAIQFSATAIKAKVLAWGPNIALLWYDTADQKLHVIYVPVLSLTDISVWAIHALTGSGNNASAINASRPDYDACVLNTGGGSILYLAFNNRTPGGGGTLWGFLPSAPSSPSYAYTGLPATSPIGLFGYGASGSADPCVIWYDTGASKVSVRMCFWTLSSGTTVDVETGITDTPLHVTGFPTEAQNYLTVLYDLVHAADGYTQIRSVTVTVSSTLMPQSGSVFAGTVLLAGKPWLPAGASVHHVPVVHNATMQPTLFVLSPALLSADGSGSYIAGRPLSYIAGRALPGTCASTGTRASLGTQPLPESGSGLMAVAEAYSLTTKQAANTGAAVVVEQSGICWLAWDFAAPIPREELGRTLNLGGSFVRGYDGQSLVENGFHLYPEGVTGSTGASGALVAGKYGYAVVWAWPDASGQMVRSAPSVPVQVTATTGASVTLTIPSLLLTDRETSAPGDLVQCEVYRTIANGSVLYMLTNPNSPTMNQPGSHAFTFTDNTVTDGALIFNPELYTQPLVAGSVPVLENAQPTGGAGSMTVHQSRLVFVDTCDPLKLWFSQQNTPGSPVEFNDSLYLVMDPRGGDTRAVVSMDEKLCAAKADRWFWTTGDGPDRTGQQGNYPDFVLANTDTGCTDAPSVATSPAGIVYKSPKGIYLLDRSLNATYLGAPVEKYNGDDVVASMLVPGTNQIRFALSSGVALVFDYFAGQWSVFSPIRAVDATIWRGLWAHLSADGHAYVETPGVYSDAGTVIRQRVWTAWAQVAALEGFQRVRRAVLAGTFRSPHRVQVGVCHDGSPAAIQSLAFVSAGSGTWGSDATWGAGAVWGGAFPQEEWRIHLARQKCTALQLQIEIVPDGTGSGEGCSLSGLTLECEVKRGLNKFTGNRSGGA